MLLYYMAKVIVGMSGGVDSSVSAYLLKQQGYDVEGVSLVLYEARQRSGPAVCCSLEARDSAADTAAALGIKHRAIDVRAAFIDNVVDPFVESYKNGMTPNPCILCNKHIKFPYLLRAADEAGAEFIATGHYARVEDLSYSAVSGQQSAKCLKKGIDLKKDQSYVLYVLSREQLDRLLLPLGDLAKEEVRNIARSLHLPAADRPESQEICFVDDNDYSGFIMRLAPETIKPGPILGTDGKIVGTHKGIFSYTIGQRKGLNIASLEPHYVTRIDPLSNTIQAGSREEAMAQQISVRELNWLLRPESSSFTAAVKVRSMMGARNASIQADENTAAVLFDEPQWAPAPGQSAVFYDGDVVIGGGIISREPSG
ncbi:MAG: tRNA 2-thiouridine(34) synthase MnmA [Nitrospirae bacterium]|nr:tRNA 2-thiouridine(34) synthase MnmA [Nitrospirota bacterium]